MTSLNDHKVNVEKIDSRPIMLLDITPCLPDWVDRARAARLIL